MASRIEFAVSATPIFTHAAGEGVTTDVIAADVRKTVGGNGSVAVTWGATGGYAAGIPSYIQVTDTIGIAASTRFLYIKHTGFAYSSGSVLGAATTATLAIRIHNLYAADPVAIAILPPGGVLVIPFASAPGAGVFTFLASSGTIAIEYFVTN